MLITTLNEPVPLGPSAVTVGKFDGVHLGHQALLAATRECAAGLGVRSGVVTFDRHPAEVLSPGSAPPYLTPLPERLRLLEESGMDACLVLPLESGVLSWEAGDFVREALGRRTGARVIVTGPDFRYGRGRRGDLDSLRFEGEALGFTVQVVPPVLVRGSRVSSYGVRQALSAGDLGAAEEMLGRRHSVLGTVVAGRQVGRTLGYPTANLAFEAPVALPALGIYVVTAEWDGGKRRAVASLGVRPTLEGDAAPVWLEVHVLDWEGDLYGRRMRVTFLARLRGEEKFASVDALTAQIGRDAEAARWWAD